MLTQRHRSLVERAFLHMPILLGNKKSILRQCTGCAKAQKQPRARVRATSSLQLCLTLYNPVDRSLPGCSVHGILQT